MSKGIWSRVPVKLNLCGIVVGVRVHFSPRRGEMKIVSELFGNNVVIFLSHYNSRERTPSRNITGDGSCWSKFV